MSETSGAIRKLCKTTAVIDWIELIVTTATPTQFRHLQAKLRDILQMPPEAPAIWVKALGVSYPNASSCRFEVRLHDEHANHIDELNRITFGLKLARPAEVAAIEIAVDFYRRDDPKLCLQSITSMLQRGIGAYGKARQYDPDTRFTNMLESSDQVDPKMNLRVGDQRDDISWQVYFKQTDKNQMPIPHGEERARAEVTLRGAALAARVHGKSTQRPTVTLADLADFRFEEVAELLHFRRLKSIDEIVKNHVSGGFVERMMRGFGERLRKSVATYPFGRLTFPRDPRTNKPRNRGVGILLKHSRHTVADDELNQLVRDRLKGLTKKFSTKF